MANREEQLKQITEQLEQGVAEIFTSEKYSKFEQRKSQSGSVNLTTVQYVGQVLFHCQQSAGII